ncbi:MAG: hypothetical protein IT158_01825 [Bryobacterales bacterium]|nr:hypothetical protein [Bryobacterales bacterium]
MQGWMPLLILIAIVAAGVVAWLYIQKQRSLKLRSRFGPEYDRAVRTTGSRRRAETDLEKRARRVEHFQIKPLPPSERDRYIDAWRMDQARFVDDPQASVLEADRLVTEVMRARGYPMADFDRRAEDLSVDHPRVVDNYRNACAIAEKARRGDADTEELRRAMKYYRSLFDELLETEEVTR